MTQVLLIAVDGLDWQALRQAIADGLAPNLGRLATDGATALFTRPVDTDDVALWTGVATGQHAEVHGVWDGEEAWAGGVRAASQASWQAPALWQQLAAAGIATASLAWPASASGADWPGCHVDDRWPAASGRDWAGWAMPRRCCPEAERERFRELRLHPAELGGDQLLPLLPDLAAIDQDRSQAVERLAVAMAAAASVQAGAAALLADPDWRFVAVHHRLLGDIRQAATAAPPPYDHLVPGCWRLVDGMVGHLAGLAGPAALVLVVGAGADGAPGAVLALGPGVTPGARLDPVAMRDVAPTILARFGLTAGLPGRVVAGLAPGDSLVPLPPLAVPAPAPATPPLPDTLPAALAAAGYRLPPGPTRRWQRHRRLRRAKAVLPRDPVAAGAEAQAVLAAAPDDVDALRLAGYAAVAAGDAGALAGLAARLREAAPDRPLGDIAEGIAHALAGDAAAARPLLLAAEASANADGLARIAGAWLLLRQAGEAERVLTALQAREPTRPDARFGLVEVAELRGDRRLAESRLRAIIADDPASVPAHAMLARLLAAGGRRQEAAVLAARAAELRD